MAKAYLAQLRLLFAAVVLLAGAGAARGFYLPGVAPTDFRKVPASPARIPFSVGSGSVSDLSD